MEAARQKLREEEIDKQMTTDLAAVRKVAKAGKEKAEGEGRDDDFGSSEDEDEDADKYAEAADAVGQKLDTKTRITVRNLRIREDTAKYLINLDPSSAYYDPKTRSMRDNPLRNVAPEEVSVHSVHVRPRTNHDFRLVLPAKTSSDTQGRPRMFRNFSCSRGTLRLVAMMSMLLQIPRKGSGYTISTRKPRKS